MVKFFKPQFKPSKWVLGIILAALAFTYACIPSVNLYYRSAADSKTNSVPWKNFIKKGGQTFLLSPPLPIIINDNTIYLLTRRVTSLPAFSAVLHTEDFEWNARKVNAIASNSLELRNLWPNTNEYNMGIEWISKAVENDSFPNFDAKTRPPKVPR